MSVAAEFDVVVVGGGITGTAIGWELAADHTVLLLEQESQLGAHATGRSAATFVETLGSAPIRALTVASRAFLEHPPEPFGPSPLGPMGLLEVARAQDVRAVTALRAVYDEAVHQVPDVDLLAGDDVDETARLLRPGVMAVGLWEPRAATIDVDALHRGFVRGLAARDGQVRRSTGLASADHDGTAWTIHDTAGGTVRARYLVDAAGAWCDLVAERAGVRPIGISPLRRTIFGLPLDPTPDTGSAGPMVVAGSFYLKPETGHLLCSPMDEGPAEPGDPRPDSLAISRALDDIDEVTTLHPRRITSSWAGLRSFAPDRLPVVGFAPDQPAFFWYAGQGGTGVQTAPALARLGGAVLSGRELAPDLAALGLTTGAFGAARSDRANRTNRAQPTS